jgi:DNA-binding NarL/FixJ family response regulator
MQSLALARRSRFDPIPVLAVMRVRIYREGLTELLQKDPKVRLLGSESVIGDDAPNGLPLEPDIVLLDRRDPDCLRTAGASLRAFPGTKLVVIGGDESDDQVEACAEAGISGHVAADVSFEELIATIEDLAHGDMPCSPIIAAALVRRVTSLVTRVQPSAIGLTRRESEVIGCLHEALSNKQIARRLDIQVATVKNHVHNILKKLAVHRRADAVNAAVDRI